jgi:AhpD family alkylhydroperoxidase
MARLQYAEPSEVGARLRDFLAAEKSRMGRINNLVKVMSNSPAVLEGYLGLNGGLDRGAIGPELAERLALTVSEANGCDYCLASHGTLAGHLGISPEEIRAARRAWSSDPRIDVALKFALAVVDRRGHVSDEELAGVKEAGYTDGDIAEIVAHVARNVLTNYLNNVAATPLDWPAAGPLPTT